MALVEPLTFGHVAGFFISSDKAWISMPGRGLLGVIWSLVVYLACRGGVGWGRVLEEVVLQELGLTDWVDSGRILMATML